MPTGIYTRKPEMYATRNGRTPWNKGTKGVCKPNSGSFKKGDEGFWIGKKRPDLASTGAAKTMFKKGSPGFVGKQTEETKQKMSISAKKRAERSTEDHKKGGLVGSKTRYEKKPTSAEKAVYDYLLLNKILFEKQKIVDNRMVVDVYIPILNLVIEVDGKDHTGKPMVRKRDRQKEEYLQNLGYRIIRISNKDALAGNIKERINI